MIRTTQKSKSTIRLVTTLPLRRKKKNEGGRRRRRRRLPDVQQGNRRKNLLRNLLSNRSLTTAICAKALTSLMRKLPLIAHTQSSVS